MTVGQKIQMYRKQLKMSQEELGQKLLVSRQTISLWEKDQTVPTIENLIRLREIFSVSVDDILGFDNAKQKDDILPNETYQFHFTRDELNEIHRLQRKNIYRGPIIFALCCIFLIIRAIGGAAHSAATGFIFGMSLLGIVSHIKGILIYRKNWENSVNRICKSTYEYRVFEDFIHISIYRENEKIHEIKCFFADIEQIQQFDKWLLLQYGGQAFMLRKEDLKESSAIFSYMYKNPSKIVEKLMNNRWKVLSIILFVASLLSIVGALVLVGVVSSKNNLFVENMWLFFLFTPIPIASIVFGFVLKSKKYKYKKNIIAGIIMSVLLCIYGSFSLIFANVYEHSDEPIVKIEQTMGIDIPTHKQINTQDWTKGTQSVSRGYIYSSSDIYFEKSVVEEFEKQIAIDDRWLSTVSNDLIGISSPFGDYGIYDYNLIYNMDTSEYNALPQKSGTFRFINILYSEENNQMRIIEYDIDYIK